MTSFRQIYTKPLQDGEALDISKILNLDALQEMMEDFYNLTKIAFALLDLQGNVLVGVGWQDICVNFHRKNPQTLEHCLESDLELTKGVKKGEYKVYECKNGLVDVVTPLYIGGRHVANIFSGQFFFKDKAGNIKRFIDQAERYGFNKEDYLSAFKKAPIWDRGQVEALMVFFIELTRMLSEKGFSNLRLNEDIAERKKAEEALKESENRFHTLFTNMLDGFAYCQMIFDKQDDPVDFVYLEINDAFEKLTGLKREQVIGRKVSEAIPNTRESNPELFTIYGRVAKTGKPERFEVYFKPLTVWLDIAVYSPKQNFFVAVFENITERKQSEERRTWLASFPELNPNPVVEADLEGKIVYANSATKLLFPDFDKLGLEHEFFWNWKSIIDALKNRGIQTFGREQKVKDKWYRQQFYFVPNSDCIRIYVMDIDELKRSEEAKARTQIKLEENACLLEEYANQMETLAKQRLEQLKEQERLVAIGQTAGMVGHDIRNPLQAITNDLYLMKEELKNQQSDKDAISESIRGIEENIFYVNKIVSDLQDYTRPFTPTVEQVDLRVLINSTLKVSNVPENITTDVAVERPLMITTDPAYLKRVLTNLMINAVQAMPNGGKLTVIARKEGAISRITVSDTGMGIPEDAKPNLFKPLFTTKSKGQGLGLAVVKRIVEGLHGTIAFESQERKGTKFIIDLPNIDTYKT